MKNHHILLFYLILFFIGCKSEDSFNSVETPPTSTSESTPEPTGEEQYLNEKSSYIFDQKKLHTFELNLPEEALAKIDADPAAEEYVEGSLTFEGETISPVGIRYKGSIGAYVGCLSGRDWANPSGRKTCPKLSMKVKINWTDSDDRFYGLKKLQFHSQNNDESQMRDRLGYWFFRKMDVPAPRAVHARLLINGEYSGIYSLVEQIDGRFTRQNFDDGTGNLYKEIWPLQSNGQPFPEQTYLDHLKTNEDENPSVEMIKTFAEEIRDAAPQSLQSVIEKWMNIDEILAYAVVDRTIRNDDGAFHWYCNGLTGADCAPHNFYWYENPTEKTMHLIPWDLDNAFENIISAANPVTPIVDGWGETRNDCEPFASGFLGIKQKSAACDKLIGGWASFKETFEIKKSEFINGPFSDEKVIEKIDEWAAQIRAATMEAKEVHPDALSVEEWEMGMEELKVQIRFAKQK